MTDLTEIGREVRDFPGARAVVKMSKGKEDKFSALLKQILWSIGGYYQVGRWPRSPSHPITFPLTQILQHIRHPRLQIRSLVEQPSLRLWSMMMETSTILTKSTAFRMQHDQLCTRRLCCTSTSRNFPPEPWTTQEMQSNHQCTRPHTYRHRP